MYRTECKKRKKGEPINARVMIRLPINYDFKRGILLKFPSRRERERETGGLHVLSASSL